MSLCGGGGGAVACAGRASIIAFRFVPTILKFDVY